MQGQETGWGSLRHALEHSTENPLLYSPTGVRVHSNNDPNWEGTVPSLGPAGPGQSGSILFTPPELVQANTETS